MRIARVTGNVSGTVKDPGLRGRTLLLVDFVTPAGTVEEGGRVVLDAVGAGAGDTVLVALGTAARQAAGAGGVPTDATAIAVIDEITAAGS